MQLIATVPLILLSIENDGFHIMVKGSINGKPANFLLDTGASRSVFDQERIQKFLFNAEFEQNERLSAGLGTSSMPTLIATIGQIAIGDFKVNDYKAVLIDLLHVHLSYQELNLPEIDGVIGGDILFHHKAVINYKTKTLKLYEKGKKTNRIIS